jgi:hypothetical protein
VEEPERLIEWVAEGVDDTANLLVGLLHQREVEMAVPEKARRVLGVSDDEGADPAADDGSKERRAEREVGYVGGRCAA